MYAGNGKRKRISSGFPGLVVLYSFRQKNLLGCLVGMVWAGGTALWLSTSLDCRFQKVLPEDIASSHQACVLSSADETHNINPLLKVIRKLGYQIAEVILLLSPLHFIFKPRRVLFGF